MKALIRIGVLALAATAAIGVAAPSAGATSVSKVTTMSYTLSTDMDAMAEAADSLDVDGLGDACSDLWGHTATAMGYTRPAGVPKAAWRHTKAGFRLLNQSAALCESGARNFDVDEINASTDLLNQATDEINLAAALMT